MVWVAGFLVVLGIALLVGGAFAAIGVRGPWSGLLWFFVLLFFATWAIGAWTRPIGPQIWGINWLGFLIVAILVGLLIAAATPSGSEPRRRKRFHQGVPSTEPLDPSDRSDHAETSETTAMVVTAIGLFFWLFIAVAVTMVVLSFIFSPVPV